MSVPSNKVGSSVLVGDLRDRREKSTATRRGLAAVDGVEPLKVERVKLTVLAFKDGQAVDEGRLFRR